MIPPSPEEMRDMAQTARDEADLCRMQRDLLSERLKELATIVGLDKDTSFPILREAIRTVAARTHKEE